MTDNFGDGVSRVLDPTGTQYLEVVYQEGAPPLDSEWNLVGQLASESNRQAVLRGAPSGWLGNDVNPSKVYQTDPSWSNWFKFGQQAVGDKQSILFASVNGWLIPVTGTQTGLPPGSPDNTDTWNKITLDPPSGSAGDSRADFVFLEVWKALISPSPSAVNKPNSSSIYKYGNLEGGMSYLPDDLTDLEIGEPTTDRVQLQHRIRVIKGLVNLSDNPEGFDPTVVRAQGTQPAPGPYIFTNMKEELGDPGLWRAGDGNPANSLGTVDGYVYAIGIACVFRRNSTLWGGDPSPNLNGAFNRNPSAVDRTGILTFSTVPTLASPLSSLDTSISLVSSSNIPLPVTGGTIQIGDEILNYTGISGTTISLATRGTSVSPIQGTIAEAHPAGAVIKILSSRPDGLFSDQITGTDLLDLRHVVNPSGFDYQSLLQSNLDKLLRGQLRSTYKRSGADPRGTYVSYQDKISATPPAILGITALDGPDDIRLTFSDAAIQQKVEVICTPASSVPITPPTPVFASWDLELTVNALVQQSANVWSVGDQIQIPVNQFQTPSLPGSDADQVRILNEVPVASSNGASFGTYQFTDSSADFVNSLVYVGDTIVIFSPLVGFPLGGSYPITEVTTSVLTSSVTIPPPVTPGLVSYEIRRGIGSVQIRIEGSATPLDQNRFEVTPLNPTPTDNLVIQLVGAGSPFPTSSSSAASQLYITLNVQYGGGRGLARRPDSLHNISLQSPTSEILISPSNIIKPAWVALWSKFRNDPYKGLLPVTAGAFADLGSKTVTLCPFRSIEFPSALYLSASALPLTSIMAQAPEGGLIGTLDPLGLFKHTVYVTLPRHLIPSFGAVNSHILPPGTSGSFGPGINFMLVSNVNTDNPTYINYTPYFFSTINLTTSAHGIYNEPFTFSGTPYAGARLFNDGGSISTNRGLGRNGIELPPYYGIAKLRAVYWASDYHDHTTSATNLLRQSFDGPTIWIERDSAGVSTFILNADAIDLSKIPSPYTYTTFAAGDYVIEANVFGFDVGAFDLTQQFRLAISSAATLTQPLPGPTTILPGPLSVGNTALVNYSRTPYQGDPWQSATAGLDIGYQRGPLDSPTAFELASTSLTGVLTRPNQKPLEVLASTGFITSLGTGRLSGDFVPPNTYDPRNVGYEDPVDLSNVRPYPPTVLSGGALTLRPITKLGAIGSSPIFTDLEANPEYLGLTTRLPLGALYRDKDLHGGRFSDQQSSPLIYLDKVGVGSGVAGLAATETLDQTESPIMPAEVSAGLPGDVVVLVDGSQNYSSLTNFRTNRGGSAFIGSGDRPGGEIFATYERVQGSVSGSRTLIGRAFLVRNAPTTVSAVQVSSGDELMLAIVTQVMELNTTPSEAMVLLGTNGSGESVSAADLYRIEGHPLIANHTFYDVDPSTVSLPVGKTIAQIAAPPDVPVIPLGALNTVYASDGSRNFWANTPTVTNLTATDIYATDAVTIGSPTITAPASVAFTRPAEPVIYQVDANPGDAGQALGITAQRSIATVATISSFTSGAIVIRTGEISSPTPGWLGNSGLLIAATGNVDANVVGNSGTASFGSGSNFGTGNTGIASLTSGQAHNGSSGAVEVGAGVASGTSGSGGTVSVSGGYVTNASNTTGSGGSVVIQAGSTVAPSGSGQGGSVTLVGGFGPAGNGKVVVELGPSSTQYASFTNTDLILGANSVTYGILFQSGTTTPFITQLDAVDVNGQSLTISSQRVVHTAGAYGDGGPLNLIAGDGVNHTGGPSAHKGGDVIVSSGSCDYGIGNGSGIVVLRIKQPFAGSPIDPITCSTTEVLVGVNTVKFKSSKTPSVITQEPNTGSASGFSLSVIAQDADPTSTDQPGGDLILSTGAPTGVGSSGTIALQLGSSGYHRVEVDESLGLHIRRNPGGGDTQLTFEVSDNDPPLGASGNNQLFVNNTGHLRFHSSTTGGGTAATLEGTVARIVDTSAFINSPVTSSGPTNLIGGTVAFTGVLNGDIIEGHAMVHITAAQSVGNLATFYLFVKDGSTLDIATCILSLSAATGIDQTITVPFSYTAVGTSGTVEFRPEAASSDGATPVTVSKPNSNGKWLFAKQTRP